MYSLVRRYIKTGIGFLAIGLVLGLWLVIQRELLDPWPHPNLVSAHAHAVLIGFVMFLILGVALWLFPRAAKDDTRYSPTRAEIAYWILLVSTAGPIRHRGCRCVVGRRLARLGRGPGWARQGGRAPLLLLDDVDADPAGGEP